MSKIKTLAMVLCCAWTWQPHLWQKLLSYTFYWCGSKSGYVFTALYLDAHNCALLDRKKRQCVLLWPHNRCPNVCIDIVFTEHWSSATNLNWTLLWRSWLSTVSQKASFQAPTMWKGWIDCSFSVGISDHDRHVSIQQQEVTPIEIGYQRSIKSLNTVFQSFYSTD